MPVVPVKALFVRFVPFVFVVFVAVVVATLLASVDVELALTVSVALRWVAL